jgi:2'-5' RNA ligase
VRLFVALEIDAKTARNIGECTDDLRRRVLEQAPQARITWVPVERLHLTVRFIGEVEAARAESIANALKPRLAVSRFTLTLEGVGAFPPRGAPRVLWAGITSDVAPLLAVEEEVTARLAAGAVPPEQKPYQPHLTLARVRNASGLRSPLLLEGFARRRFGVSPVDAITLFQSRLSPKGPTYVPLQRTPLHSS